MAVAGGGGVSGATMTDADWRGKSDPYFLLKHRATEGDRKRRLLDCACVRRVLHLVSDPCFEEAVTAAEDIADGNRTWDEVKLTVQKVALLRLRPLQRLPEMHTGRCAAEAAVETTNRRTSLEGMNRAAFTASCTSANAGRDPELAEQAILVRDIFGNPFRPVAFAPEWRTASAVALAEAMYAARAFDRMPVLADALEEAGCTHPDILAHCRGDGPHVRGCWVVDLVLDKA